MDWNKIISNERLRASSKPYQNITIDIRNEFESDRGRIIFSPAVRRMHDKTQAWPFTWDDHIHTRLTHSLEVNSVAHSLGVYICYQSEFESKISKNREELLRIIPTIVSSAALCHDIGNPPFGHFGEEVIQNYFTNYFKKNHELEISNDYKQEFEKFDGNAQGFRILTKLLILQDLYGLNLTVGTLSSFLKYPRLIHEIDKDDNGYKHRVGVLYSEKDLLLKLREITGLDKVRNPLAFLVEAADTICYLIMDIEDVFNMEYYNFNHIFNYIKEKTKGNSEIEILLSEFESFVTNNNIEDNPNSDVTKMVIFRVMVVQDLVNTACHEFINNIDGIDKGLYTNELIYAKPGLAHILKQYCNENIYENRKLQKLEITGESVLIGLLDHFVTHFVKCTNKKSECYKIAKMLYNIISRSMRYTTELETGEKNFYDFPVYNKLRLVVDFISGMTDKYALSLFQQLQGIKIA